MTTWSECSDRVLPVRRKQLTAIVSLKKKYEIKVSILMSVLAVKTFIAILW